MLNLENTAVASQLLTVCRGTSSRSSDSLFVSPSCKQTILSLFTFFKRYQYRTQKIAEICPKHLHFQEVIQDIRLQLIN